MQENIYGDYQPVLAEILAETLDKLEEIKDDYQTETGDRLYEHLIGRVKTPKSMIEKCQRKNLPLNVRSALKENKDSIGVRIVCNFIDDIYTWIDIIEHLNNVAIVKQKDYITHAKPNGYRSYHLILEVTYPVADIDGNDPGQYFIEVQLRTIAMDTWASLEHEMKYKHTINNPEMIGQELKRVADELASCDVSMQTIRQLIREDD
ncbi:GTP pyrophosphokinase family protein [Lactobacillus sp. PV037]|uniref:GTP pyrophosphokinase n=1 Tax=unclassified Lactobacillus TaxID=2620435 RepID=UPI00223FF4FF|nr:MULTISPECIES: GTP pyrophosphokinase family protein [unclassified Lactobacillus]QNQ82045.1 GTP pyrophosphokinase family protein [Lactobacillus sp. PV012]QNQ83920.1 GTP pyrophosphokinase family protein [Lactobacillus sp. PV037]